jgi:hypothetical protein
LAVALVELIIIFSRMGVSLREFLPPFLFIFFYSLSSIGNKKLILKMGDDRECSFGSRIDVYFNLREGQVYPLGLFVGTEVELTWLCLRKTHKTGRLYCTSTLLTCIRLLKIGRNFG